MQTGCGCSDRTGPPGEDRLVARVIVRHRVTFANVRRDRHLAVSCEQVQGVSCGLRLSEPVTFRRTLRQAEPQPSRFHLDGLPGTEPASRLAQQLPQAVGKLAQNNPSHLPPVLARRPRRRAGTTFVSFKTSRSRGFSSSGKSWKTWSRQRRVGSAKYQQEGLVAFGTGFLGDEVRGEVVIQEVRVHCSRRIVAAETEDCPFLLKGTIPCLRERASDHLKPLIHSSKPFL